MSEKLPPLKDRGTAGLLQYVATGPDALYGARLKNAMKIIQRRYSDQDQRAVFVEVANDSRAKRNGWAVPKLSPLKRILAAKAGDQTAYYV
jgi:hypothetical protein